MAPKIILSPSPKKKKSSSTTSNNTSTNNNNKILTNLEIYIKILLKLNYTFNNNNPITELNLIIKKFLIWFKDSIQLNNLNEISLIKEEKELYDKALSYNLVKSIPTRQVDQDLDPELLIFPSNYQSPTDIITSIAQNDVGMKILSNHVEREQQRHETLLTLISKLSDQNSKSVALLAKNARDLAKVETELRSKSDQLQSSISLSVESLLTASESILSTTKLENFPSLIDNILSQSSDYSTLLSTFSTLIPSPSFLNRIIPTSIDIEDIAIKTSTLESQILFGSSSELSLQAVASREFEKMTIKELELLLLKEEKNTEVVEKKFREKVEKRVREEVRISQVEQRTAELNRATSFINMLKSAIESDVSTLLHTYNSLARTHDILINFKILSLTLNNILEEITTLSTTSIPPSPSILSTESNLVFSGVRNNNDKLLFEAVEGLVRIPILNREELKKALEEVEDQYLTKIEILEKVNESNTQASNLLQAHLNLYSPTSILVPISKSIQELLNQANKKEKLWKGLLNSDTAKNVEISKKDREALKRMELILKGMEKN